jgi:hypothetical protein
MNAERHFERLAKIEALLAAGSGATDGERAAAVAARDRARAAAAADGVDWRNPPKREAAFSGRWPGPADWEEFGRRVGREVWERLERDRQDAEAREFERHRKEQAQRRREHHAAVRERYAKMKPPTEAQLNAWAKSMLRRWTPEQQRKRVFAAGWRPISWSEWRSPSGATATLEEAAREVAKARVMEQRDERRKFNDFVDSLG